ncbi:uncharacterized protein FOMMEDRAFT_107555 [Fomitiporia mediterranea MF3/22]|uniref:uncharacterized protein n=1 Tax=Fomitiporia mediterranea (strain MF3/22) TaxID=694068 RepID=UPI0004407FFD|nr:uncharacterized protein FOMMEDRAFT_107555 [Fomitiporia mediterranea MF3/22]EJD02624.1 hypothetical protein FOMMEDRAFT_107555 [Fomitiporia mediterranea MF3/22]
MSAATKARSTGIPTPGRLRSYSSSASTQEPLPTDFETSNRAFQDAMKSNDPARYTGRSVSANNPAPRPPSSASGSNIVSRPRTPSSQFGKPTPRHSESRQSDAHLRKHGAFAEGDDVRIESLGFEGKLRYVGEIEGKPGIWAGVELCGGFVGLGKNNGWAGKKQYFSCPDKCGVFVAYNKLSAPTVMRGTHSRSSSVASSRASLPGPGRITPSLAGRTTSTIQNGRVTPAKSNGRVTPSSSLELSSGMTRIAPRPSLFNPTSATNTPSATAMSKITAGSRASKYVGMTAQQLSARSQKTLAPGSPSRKSIGLGSPTRRRGPPSPSRSDSRNSSGGTPIGGTPKPATRLSFGMGTPKGFGSGRPSLTTPRARIPSAVAMPPPPSPTSGGGAGQRSISLNDKPVTPTFSTTSNETAVDDEGIESLVSIQNNSKALKDKIQSMLASRPQRSESPSRASNTHGMEEDSVFGHPKLDASLQALQERVDSLERENLQLKSELEASQSSQSKAGGIETITSEREQALDRIKDLESQLKSSERTMDERNSKIESLERSVQTSTTALQAQRAEDESRLNDLQSKLDESQSLITSLKDAIEAKSNEAGQNEGIIQAKDAEINLLEGRVKKASSELDDVRKDLTAQIDELRHAGQETIALYEERLAAADSRRYQLEDLVDRLEEQLKRRTSLSKSQNSVKHESAEAMRIDNEALREQAVHLQKRITSLEDMLEEARGNLEREESNARARIQRHKEHEAALRAELVETRGEVERLVKSESSARVKAEEAEEALRENTITLENAQAEIEGLRAEIASLENIQARNSSERSRSEESSRILSIERERHSEEVAQLKDLLEVTRSARKEAVQDLDAAKQDALNTSNSLSSLKQAVEDLDAEKAELEHSRSDLESKLERERAVTAELRRALDEKASELEASRKTLNRDRPILQDATSSPATTTPSKQESSYKEEIKGLKHIVQELQKEISTLSGRAKMLESENKMLSQETDALRQELKVLEENVEQDILAEERALSSGEGDQSKTNSDSQTNAEVERLRKQLAEVEKKTARTIHELNKEVSELESLVEAKIYREDELEREIERFRHQASKRPSKSSIEPPHSQSRHSATSSTATVSLDANGSNSNPNAYSIRDSSSTAVANSEGETDGVCEICEGPGHDIFSCPLLKDGSGTETLPSTKSTSSGGGQRGGREPVETDLFCEDCESHGHLAADCPYSSDVF